MSLLSMLCTIPYIHSRSLGAVHPAQGARLSVSAFCLSANPGAQTLEAGVTSRTFRATQNSGEYSYTNIENGLPVYAWDDKVR